MNRRMKRVGFAVLMFFAMLTAPSAEALTSSYYDGSVFYNTEEGLAGRIDFAVYDTENAVIGDEYMNDGIGIPGQGRYIYAYQIFQSPFSGSDVSYFGILDASGNPIDESLINGTSAQDDGEGGIAPSPIFSETEGTWVWTVENGYIAADEHSWLLVFSTDNNLTFGDYEIRGTGIPAPVPEPATIAVFSLGSLFLTARRRARKA
jgi:hypothetical protein